MKEGKGMKVDFLGIKFQGDFFKYFLSFLVLFSLINGFCVLQGYSQSQGDRTNLIPAIKFKDADIKIVLQSIAQKATKKGERVNIVTGVEVRGLVSINLENVNWLTAMEAILKVHGYDYEWIGENIILVETLEKLAIKREAEALAKQQEPLDIATYELKYLEAHDVLNVIKPQLSPRGRITVLEPSSDKGWKSRGGLSTGGTAGEFARAQRLSGARPRSSTIIITETKSKLRSIIATIDKIDLMPKQILIEVRIMEVGVNWLRDIGLELGTGLTGVTGDFDQIDLQNGSSTLGGSSLSSVSPSVFSSPSALSSTYPFDGGAQLLFKHIKGDQFEILLHALEEDVNTNVLSAPRVVTLDGQEAYIMVGTKRPIITSKIESSQISVGISKQLAYYEILGIELNVVPKICGDGYINMLLYPSVTSSTTDTPATSQVGESTSTDFYPIIDVREVQTQVLIKDGETIVIGGLIKEVKNESVIKIPLLGDIPYLGQLFKRTTVDTEKVDLMIFITASILDPSEIGFQEFSQADIDSLEEDLTE